MPLQSELVKSLAYLRGKYKVSERDLVGLAKRLQKTEEKEETWDDIVAKTMGLRRRRVK